MAELVALENVTAGYGDSKVLDDVTLSLAEGDSLALLGRNGVGKTTLLVTMIGLTRVHAGKRAVCRAATCRPRRPTSVRERASAGCRRNDTCGPR